MNSKNDSDNGFAKELEKSLEQIINSMASHFFDHPGFMWTDGGFEVIHANWPAYPLGKGLRNALSQFGDFPSNIEFSPIDHIDQCTLFVVKGYKPGKEFDSRNYHVAIWDEDLRELVRNNCINGISLIKDEIEYYDFVSLSEKGEKTILFQELAHDVHPKILELVQDFISTERYDTAIREASLLLETQLRQAIGTKDFGQTLVEKCFGENGVLLPSGLPKSSQLEMHGMFKRFFNYVRNDFAHSFSNISLVTTVRLLRRCSRLLELVIILKNEMSSDK